ncbi:hypothetical protein TIFTF001_021534 [Ficus carica]|uniref:Uncharacterized protein n=1 Tax=Ficus carica TaxID=3494 RepID=A0AA88AYW6_FICCA|nr:hypothetical protein TIFTF001_021534 [Ficus carica]
MMEQKIYHDDHVHEGLIPNVTFIGIQGIILCELGPNEYLPLEGAKARITCPSSHQNGNNEAESSSIPSPRTDEHGFFLVTLSVSKLTDKSINIQECRAFLEYSPLESCNVPIRN